MERYSDREERIRQAEKNCKEEIARWERQESEEQYARGEYLRLSLIRFKWQIMEMERFINDCFVKCAALLAKEPIKVPSGKYEERLKMERTQADMVNEMAQELANLPRFIAFAKVLKEENGVQSVLKRKMHTLPVRSMTERYPVKDEVFRQALEEAEKKGFQDAESRLLEKTASSGMCKSREEIEKEIRTRQEPWRGRGRSDRPPPSKSDDLREGGLPPGSQESLPETPPPNTIKKSDKDEDGGPPPACI